MYRLRRTSDMNAGVLVDTSHGYSLQLGSVAERDITMNPSAA